MIDVILHISFIGMDVEALKVKMPSDTVLLELSEFLIVNRLEKDPSQTVLCFSLNENKQSPLDNSRTLHELGLADNIHLFAWIKDGQAR